MRFSRYGAHRFCGTTTIVGRKPSKIEDLRIDFYNVPDFNSESTHHNYILELTNEELDQLLAKRRKRIRRENLVGSVLLKNANGNSQVKERLWELLDQHLEKDDDRQLLGLEPREG